MDLPKLRRHIKHYCDFANSDAETHTRECQERQERKMYFCTWTGERLARMSEADFQELLSKLWAMLIWGNKKYVADKLIQDNGLDTLRDGLNRLLWGTDPVEQRWDWFRSHIKGMGPAMMSELLCHVHPGDCMLWNRRAFVALRYLGVENLPRYDYQLTGKRYVALSAAAKQIGAELANAGITNTDFLAIDYFMWRELQVTDNLSQLGRKAAPAEHDVESDKPNASTAVFLHNDVRDKLSEIGEWLGFKARTEVSIAPGSKVDAIWEATIGNMGRVIYVFEVQTRGSIDSLIINLLKSLKNPAVQCTVAVSDKQQLEKIRAHSADVSGLSGKLKYWDYEEVLRVYESLASAYESINGLGLVPQGF